MDFREYINQLNIDQVVPDTSDETLQMRELLSCSVDHGSGESQNNRPLSSKHEFTDDLASK